MPREVHYLKWSDKMPREVHHLKIWPQYFQALQDGSKNFDVRRDDRNFRVGDFIVFEEFNPDGFGQEHGESIGEYTGRQINRQIIYVLPGGPVTGTPPVRGIRQGFAVLGLKPIANFRARESDDEG